MAKLILTDAECRDIVRRGQPIEHADFVKKPAKRLAKPPTKKMARAMAIARSLNREDVAYKIVNYRNKRGDRTAWDVMLRGWSNEVADAYFGVTQ